MKVITSVRKQYYISLIKQTKLPKQFNLMYLF